MWFNNMIVNRNQIEDFKILNMYENIDRNVLFHIEMIVELEDTR